MGFDFSHCAVLHFHLETRPRSERASVMCRRSSRWLEGKRMIRTVWQARRPLHTVLDKERTNGPDLPLAAEWRGSNEEGGDPDPNVRAENHVARPHHGERDGFEETRPVGSVPGPTLYGCLSAVFTLAAFRRYSVAFSGRFQRLPGATFMLRGHCFHCSRDSGVRVGSDTIIAFFLLGPTPEDKNHPQPMQRP